MADIKRTSLHDPASDKDVAINNSRRMEVSIEEINAYSDRTTDNMGIAIQTDAIMNDTTVLIPKFAIINASTNGNNTLVAVVSGKKIRVLFILIILGVATTIRFESNADGTALTGQMEIGANSGFAPGFCPTGHFETVSGELLNLELSAANNADGYLTYVEV